MHMLNQIEKGTGKEARSWNNWHELNLLFHGTRHHLRQNVFYYAERELDTVSLLAKEQAEESSCVCLIVTQSAKLSKKERSAEHVPVLRRLHKIGRFLLTKQRE